MKKIKINISYMTIIAILIGLIFLMTKCKNDQITKLESENIITKNNIEVLTDSIKTYKSQNGDLISERGVLVSTKRELKDLNKELYDEVKELEKEIPKSKASVVIKYKTKIVHDTLFIKSNLVSINDSTYKLKFDKDTIYDENNSRHLSGVVTINLSKDTNNYSGLTVSHIKLTKDIVNMDATLVLGTKDDKLKVWVKSDYPGFNTDEIDAVTLDPNIHPELKQLNKKKHSIGPVIGVGINHELKVVPMIGIGYQYNILKF
jgi:hypothetical protein